MAAYCQYLSQQAVECDPCIYVDDGPKEYAHELVIVWNKDEVLVGHRNTGGQVDYQNDPGTDLRVTQSRESAHEDTVAEQEELEG